LKIAQIFYTIEAYVQRNLRSVQNDGEGCGMTSSILRGLLVADIVLMALLAIGYLSQRRLEWRLFCAWGLLALLVPILGPFLVIRHRPGEWRTPPAADSLPFGQAGLRILSGRLMTHLHTGSEKLVRQILDHK